MIIKSYLTNTFLFIFILNIHSILFEKFIIVYVKNKKKNIDKKDRQTEKERNETVKCELWMKLSKLHNNMIIMYSILRFII